VVNLSEKINLRV
jgi:hypothetical protein